MSYFEYLYENANEDIIEYIIEESAYEFATDVIDSENEELIESLIFFYENIEEDNSISDYFLENILFYVECTSKIYSDVLFEGEYYSRFGEHDYEKRDETDRLRTPEVERDYNLRAAKRAVRKTSKLDRGTKEKIIEKEKDEARKQYKKDVAGAQSDYRAINFINNIAASNPHSKAAAEVRRERVKDLQRWAKYKQRKNKQDNQELRDELAQASKEGIELRNFRKAKRDAKRANREKDYKERLDRINDRKKEKAEIRNELKNASLDAAQKNRFAKNIETGNSIMPDKELRPGLLTRIKTGIGKAFTNAKERVQKKINYFRKSDNPYSANKYESPFARSNTGKKLIAAKQFIKNKFKRT